MTASFDDDDDNDDDDNDNPSADTADGGTGGEHDRRAHVVQQDPILALFHGGVTAMLGSLLEEYPIFWVYHVAPGTRHPRYYGIPHARPMIVQRPYLEEAYFEEA